MSILELPDGFQEPDWTRPLSIDHHREMTPRDVLLRGHFFGLVQEEARKNGVELDSSERYYSFKQYPVHDFYDLVEEALPKLFPKSSTRVGLRKLGQRAYPSFFETRMGRFIFGVFGNNVSLVFRAAQKGYGVTISKGSGDVLEYSDKHVILSIRNMYTFVDSYHVGLMEGVIEHHGCVGRVGVKMHSDTDVDIAIRWVEKLAKD